MWTAYWEYVNKARGYTATRGESNFDEGSQSAALLRVYREQESSPEPTTRACWPKMVGSTTN